MEEFAFNLFREVDKLFDTKYVNTSKFYNDNKVTQYCPKQDGYTSCYNDYQRINAIGTYVFMELIGKYQKLNGMDDERYLSYFIMWISHILYRRFEDNTFTLNSIYDKHLKNNFGNFNYWNILHNKKYLTNSNIAIMNVLYFLFQQILDTIKTTQTEDIQPHEYANKALEFYVIYNKIFKHINPCGPYRELLNHLKTTYNEFIKIAKNKNANNQDVLNQLIELSPKEKKFGDKFNSKGCIKIHKKLNDNTSKLIKIGNSMLKDYAKKKTQNTPDLIESQDTAFYYYYGYDDDDVNGGDGINGGDDVNSGDDAIDDDDDLGTSDDTKDDLSINADNKNQNLDPKQGNSTDVSRNDTQMNNPSTSDKSPSQGEASGDKHGITPPKIEDTLTPIPVPMKQTRDDNSQQSHQITDSNIPGGASTPSDSGSKDTGNIKEPQENKQGGIGGDKQDSGGGIGDKTNPHSDPNTPSSHPLTSDTNQGNPNDGSVDGKGDTDKGPSNTGGGQNDKGGPGDGSNGDQGSQGDPGGKKDSGGGAPGDQAAMHSSGGSNGYFSNLWKTHLNPMNHIPSVSNIYQSSKDILTNATNKVSNAYNSAITIAQDTYDKSVDIVKGAYDKTVTTVKNAYTTSTNYISGTVNSITNQFNSFGGSQLSGDQSGSGGSGNSLPTDNNPSNTMQVPTPDPNLPSPPPPSPPPPSPSLPPIPQSQPPSATSPPSQPQSNQPQGPSPSITPDPQTLSDPPSSKSLDPQTSSTTIQQIAPTDGNKAFQIPPSGQGTLASSGSNSLNTKNENVISVANVKVKETSSIWCIGSNNKCDITGISIIVISISIILTIMYKYLSLGRTSKSKRKKSMKKVINSIGGKRPIQIIIKSYDRNKDLKPIINSVDRKKDSLLNIYKLMQADPIPFINVFFLLIFFVYKRQLNYLEL
ncbi:CIR protein PIR protein [Plasmodium vinckei brucechwatti]|uniref:CIR protein PIR protein n=1 Tax=Plasmodium vinckei brucechwatti TaxID=119398 RepID=A0A6V7RV33_PLAVN|nr:CIR protein PIR protein [Plasmodium vinckei brucechwatti]